MKLYFAPILYLLIVLLSQSIFSSSALALRFGFDVKDEHAEWEWETVTGSWEIKDGMLRGGTVGSGEGLIVVGDQEWTDYTVEMKIQSTDAMPRVIFGVVTRFQDNSNYNVSSMVDEENLLKAYVKQGGYNLQETTPIEAAPNTWYVLKVVCTGDKLQVFLDGKKLVEYDNNPHAQGRVGVRTWDDQVEIDYLMVDGPEIPVSPQLAVRSHDKMSAVWGEIKHK